MYQQRVTAFIDILGFGSLVERSENDENLQHSISNALDCASPETMERQDYVRINESVVPPEELDEVRAVAAQFVKAMKMESPVSASQFSDCVVLSAEADDTMGTQLILDLICKLSIRLWLTHQLTMRGGITLGKLHHTQGGQLFGPAMNRAYYLERDHAKFPRIILDETCLELFGSQKTFRPMRSLFHQGEDFVYMSLGTCFKHTLTDSTWVLGADDYRSEILRAMLEIPARMEAIIANIDNEGILAKWKWLQADFDVHLAATPH